MCWRRRGRLTWGSRSRLCWVCSLWSQGWVGDSLAILAPLEVSGGLRFRESKDSVLRPFLHVPLCPIPAGWILICSKPFDLSVPSASGHPLVASPHGRPSRPPQPQLAPSPSLSNRKPPPGSTHLWKAGRILGGPRVEGQKWGSPQMCGLCSPQTGCSGQCPYLLSLGLD